LPKRSQRLYLVLLGALFALLVGLSFWHTSLSVGDFRPDNTAIGFVLWGMLTLVALGVLALGFILFRNLLKLYIERRQGRLGSRIKTKLVGGALVLSIVPVVAMVVFSFTIMSRTLDKWLFSQTPQILANSEAMLEEITRIMREKTAADAAWVAGLPLASSPLQMEGSPDGALDELSQILRGLDAQYVGFLPAGATWASWEVRSGELISGAVEWRLPDGATEPEASGITNNLVWGVAPVQLNGEELGRVVVAWRIPDEIQSRIATMNELFGEYRTVEAERSTFKYFYLGLLALIAIFVLFVSVWLALYLSRQISTPIEALISATAAVSSGHLEHRVEVPAMDELGGLITSFNHMTQELEEQTTALQQSNLELEGANAEIDSRRRLINAILESVTPAVLSVNEFGEIFNSNPAVGRVFRLAEGQAPRRIDDLFPPEDRDDLHYMLQRARRTGLCSRNFELQGKGSIQHLAVTVTSLEDSEAPTKDLARYVMVVEDTTDLLRGQKEAAWTEVARRVAHEIKNPLTPIALSAERMQKLLAKFAETSDPEARRVLRESFSRSTQTIVGEVETLRRLVDEFAQLAQFPKAQLEPGDLNEAVLEAAAVFDGRLSDIQLRVETTLALPPVMIDREHFKRLAVNLIDNAAEALAGGLVKEIVVRTAVSETPDSVVLTVSDSGPGISPKDKERLFLPYFSTKERGTGLGLAIVSRIATEHGGTIRVEDNRPTGTRFIVELPVAEVPALVGAKQT
jgi:two-component system nitrogen regulation sensor histidine kinase NtrY